MLEALLRYAQEHGLEAEPGFEAKRIRWAIVCDSEGRFLDVVELGDTESRRNRGQSFVKCPNLTQPEMVAGGEIKSHFLADTTQVIALYGDKVTDSKNVAKHEYFIKLMIEASEVMPPLLSAVRCLSSEITLEEIRNRLSDLKARSTDKITFKIEGSFPVECEAWHEWWRSHRAGLKRSKTANKMRCFATGELIEPVRTHPKIKYLTDVGGKPSGDVLIGFDKDSFRSYGLEQSVNAAVSEEAASSYRDVLNYLIEEHGQRLAGAKVVHWFKGKIDEGDDPLPWLVEGQSERELNAQARAREMLDSIRSGERIDLLENYYYAVTLSGASGRVMVRDWMEGQFEELLENIHSWFDDLSIVHRNGDRLAALPKFYAVLGAAVRELNELTAPFVTRMWHVAVKGELIPGFALSQTQTRAKIDIIQNEPFNHARMGLMKAYHVRKSRYMGGNAMADDLKPQLNEEHPNPAYQCGRLMAVLAGLQHSALGDVGAGLVQRYYAAASTTPALVLGRITRNSQFHLSKLDPGLARWYEDKLANIWSRLDDTVPVTLNLEEQSLFALGYYQQMADMRKKKNVENNKKGE